MYQNKCKVQVYLSSLTLPGNVTLISVLIFTQPNLGYYLFETKIDYVAMDEQSNIVVGEYKTVVGSQRLFDLKNSDKSPFQTVVCTVRSTSCLGSFSMVYFVAKYFLSK